jgi:hypothetical protein
VAPAHADQELRTDDTATCRQGEALLLLDSPNHNALTPTRGPFRRLVLTVDAHYYP